MKRLLALLCVILFVLVGCGDTQYNNGYEKGYEEAKGYFESQLKDKYDEGYNKGYEDSSEDYSNNYSNGNNYDNSSYDDDLSKIWDEDYNNEEDTTEEIVYVTRTGTKYHKDGCQYLSHSKIEMELNDAIAQGYTKCSKCW
jgi:hypothetical protein